MTAADIFLVSTEAKDQFCLDAFVPGLRAQCANVRSLNVFEDLTHNRGQELYEFLECPFPVAVIASVSAVDVLRSLRPAATFLCIGVEHGFAPFKAYTYGSGLLQADYYLAPTRGWAQRLMQLFPEQRAKIRLGGYPKIEVLRKALQTERCLPPAANKNADAGRPRLLFILSWGVSELALRDLPDLAFIDYLLHPADAEKISTSCMNNARVRVSAPELTPSLIARADVVVGDFSSLTLECLHLGKRVSFVFDRSLYAGTCDVGEEFLDRTSPSFGQIPFSDQRILPADTLDAESFRSLIDRCGDDLEAFWAAAPAADFPRAFLPADEHENETLGALEIIRIIAEERDRPASLPIAQTFRPDWLKTLQDLRFLSRAYQSVLGRDPDIKGVLHYGKGLKDADVDRLTSAAAVLAQLSGSPEATGRKADNASDDGVSDLLRALSSCTKEGPRVLRILDALADHVLPAMHRSLRDQSGSEIERVHWGLKLVGSHDANHDDFIQLAHALADLDRLDDALFWLNKGLALEDANGDVVRFKASVLERMGRLEESLSFIRAEQPAQQTIESLDEDIARIRGRYLSDLRSQVTSSDPLTTINALLKIRTLSQSEEHEPNEPEIAPAEQIRRLSLLATVDRADRSDLITLAHACSLDDRLTDALHWLHKASLVQAPNGELLRFKASLLERQGLLKDALQTARLAKEAGAEPHAINEDLARLAATASKSRAAPPNAWRRLRARGTRQIRLLQ